MDEDDLKAHSGAFVLVLRPSSSSFVPRPRPRPSPVDADEAHTYLCTGMHKARFWVSIHPLFWKTLLPMKPSLLTFTLPSPGAMRPKSA